MKDNGSVLVGAGTIGFALEEVEMGVLVVVLVVGVMSCWFDTRCRRFDNDSDGCGTVPSMVLHCSTCRIIARGELFQ